MHHHPPTGVDLVDTALMHQAPALTTELSALLSGEQLTKLAAAIMRVRYIETKNHDHAVAVEIVRAAAQLAKARGWLHAGDLDEGEQPEPAVAHV